MVFEILAYITGALIVLLGIFIFLFPQRKRTLFIKMCTDIVTAINGVFIYYATGNLLIFASVATCTIGVFRDIIFGLRDKYKIFNYYFWPILFAILNLSTLFFTYQSPISLLPAIGTVVSCLTLYLFNQKLVKCGAIFCQTLYVIYYAILIPASNILTIFSLLSAITTLTGSIIGLTFLLFYKKKDENIVQKSNEEGKI